MIVREQPSTLQLFFVLRGSILTRIYPKILFFAAWAALVDLVSVLSTSLPAPSISSMGVFGVALTLFLAFRNTIVFDRWWEARKLWGSIVADVRALSQECLIHLDAPEERRSVLLPVGRFFHAHKAMLRNTSDDALPLHLETDAAAPQGVNVPAFWLSQAAQSVHALAKADRLDAMGRFALSNRLSDLALQQAGNERIKYTPVPFVYSLLVRRTTYVYCALLPFALADAGGLFAPAITAVVAYAFFGLQAVTNELEDPFTLNDNGLPLDAICRVCDNTILAALDQPTLPASAPVDYVLS